MSVGDIVIYNNEIYKIDNIFLSDDMKTSVIISNDNDKQSVYISEIKPVNS